MAQLLTMATSSPVHTSGRRALVTVATDLLSLVLLMPPGEWGADVVVGNSQRFWRSDGLRGAPCGVLRYPR